MPTTLGESKLSRVTRKWYEVTRKYHSCISALVTLLLPRIITIGVCPAAH